MWSLRWYFTNKSITGAPYSIKSYTVCHTAGHYGEEYDDWNMQCRLEVAEELQQRWCRMNWRPSVALQVALPVVYHRDHQALSTARFCRAGQLATADTCLLPCLQWSVGSFCCGVVVQWTGMQCIAIREWKSLSFIDACVEMSECCDYSRELPRWLYVVQECSSKWPRNCSQLR